MDDIKRALAQKYVNRNENAEETSAQIEKVAQQSTRKYCTNTREGRVCKALGVQSFNANNLSIVRPRTQNFRLPAHRRPSSIASSRRSRPASRAAASSRYESRTGCPRPSPPLRACARSEAPAPVLPAQCAVAAAAALAVAVAADAAAVAADVGAAPKQQRRLRSAQRSRSSSSSILTMTQR